MRHGTAPWLCTMLLANALAHAACEQAQSLYEQALRPGVAPDTQVSLLERSLDACDSFVAYTALAQAYTQHHDLPRAIATLRKAYGFANTPDEKATLWRDVARLYRTQQDDDNALLGYKTSLRFVRQPAVEQEMLALERTMGGGLLTASRMVATLSKGLASRSVGIEPTIDVRVHFNFDAATLTPQGEQQAAEIGKALTAAELQGKKFHLIGHTDHHGTEAYNLQLSRARAATVQRYLLQHFALPAEVVAIDGRGKQELLYHDAAEDAQALNRRVEVRIE